MAVKASEQRRADLQQIRKYIAELDRQLADLPRVMRLSTNEDFKWYAEYWKRAAEPRKKALEISKDVFFRNPCGVDDLLKLKQASGVANAYLEAVADLIEGPTREIARLRKIQDEELPKLREQLSKIEEASKHD